MRQRPPQSGLALLGVQGGPGVEEGGPRTIGWRCCRTIPEAGEGGEAPGHTRVVLGPERLWGAGVPLRQAFAAPLTQLLTSPGSVSPNQSHRPCSHTALRTPPPPASALGTESRASSLDASLLCHTLFPKPFPLLHPENSIELPALSPNPAAAVLGSSGNSLSSSLCLWPRALRGGVARRDSGMW